MFATKMMCFHRFKYGQGYPSAGLFFRWFQKQIILYRKWRFSVHKKGVIEWKTATYCVRKSCLFGYHLFNCLLGINFLWYIRYVICKMFVSVDLKLNTLLASEFCFYFVLNSWFVLHLCCWIWQSSNVGWAWLRDCFGRLSPNLCCLF